VGKRRGTDRHTATHTDARDQYTFGVVTTQAKCDDVRLSVKFIIPKAKKA